MREKSVWTGIRRGLSCRCPTCGKGRLFDGFLKIREPCEVCGADNTIYPADDFPPYLTIFAVGHIVVPMLLWTDFHFDPPLWLQAAIWLPVTGALSLALLPAMKGAASGLCWAVDLVRQ